MSLPAHTLVVTVVGSGVPHFLQHCTEKLTWFVLPLMVCYLPVLIPHPPENLDSNLSGNSLTQERKKSEHFFKTQ